MNNNILLIENKINTFKRKLLFSLLLKGISFFFVIVLTLFVFINYLEYFLYLPAYIKTIVFFSFVMIFVALLLQQIILPTKKYIQYKKTLTNEKAAQIIGSHFPDIQDKLLNTIQLQYNNNKSLALNSVEQRAVYLSNFDFNTAINNKENNKLYFWLLLPLILLIITGLYNTKILFEGSQRLLDFNKTYQPAIPFKISLLNASLNAFENEAFEIKFKITGEFAADNIYLNIDGVNKKAKSLNQNQYTYTIPKVNKSFEFKVNIAGYESEEYKVEIIKRPKIKKASLKIKYPNYLNKENKVLENLSSITIPEGTKIEWLIETKNNEKTKLIINDKEVKVEKELIKYHKTINDDGFYEIKLSNKYSENIIQHKYKIDVVKDKYPSIKLNAIEDTNKYSYILLDGQIDDDYGFNKMVLNYKINNDPYQSELININKNQPTQNYIYNWQLDSLKLSKEDNLTYYLDIYDNDEVNGSKKTSSIIKTYKLPSNEIINNALNKESENIENNLAKTLEKLKKEREKTDELDKNVMQKKNLDWQDKKNIEDQLKKQKELKQEIEKLNNEFKNLNEKQEKLSNKSENIKEKAKQLEKLMNEVLDEETKKLYEELQKLLQENKPKDEDLKKALDDVNKKSENMEKELERALKLMKQLKLQLKTENLAQKLEDLAKKEEKLSEKSKNKQHTNESLQEEQQNIKKEFEKTKEEINDLDKLNEELNNKKDYFDKNTSEEKNNAENEMNKSLNQLEKNNNKKASDSQKSASESMQKMSEKLMEMAESGEEEQVGEDLKTVRQILENLINLSFSQEQLMDKFKTIKKVNPQFVENSASQIKIKDDSKIIEDSLLALASRNFQIEAFVTDELFEMNNNIDKSLEAIRSREINKITVNQQLAMTSMNNLALLLSDVAEQMQQQMSKSMDGNQQCNRPKNKPGGEKLSILQKELSEKITELKKSGKQGESLSEELAKLAAEQEALREALKEEMKEKGIKPGDQGQLEKLMEENEKDLVNKRLLNLSQMRQEEIMTRLLKAEKALRERELDEKREAQQAKNNTRNNPPEIEKYLKEKEKEIELLKTISPQYSPYFKKEIKKYFESETK